MRLQTPCPGDPSPIDFTSACVRQTWAALVPAAFVLLFLRLAMPVPKFMVPRTSNPFRNFLTLQEADALAYPEEKPAPADAEAPKHTGTHAPLWRTLLLTGGAVVETLAWLAVGIHALVTRITEPVYAVLALVISATWLYAVARRPRTTPSKDVFTLYTAHLCGGAVLLGGVAFDHDVYGYPLPPPLEMAALVANLLLVLVMMGVMLVMPIAIPGERVNPQEIGKSVSPEDYTTLWGWISFHWVYPVIRTGRAATLQDADVWALSTTLQSRPLYIKFAQLTNTTLARKLWAANVQDFTLDFVLTLLSVVLAYASPFFLNKILDSIDVYDPTNPRDRSTAYIYAIVACFCALLKSEIDLQRLWYNRRAATRARSELMAAIYDKSLKRRDLSGSIDKDKAKESANGKDGKKDNKKGRDEKEEKKAGADIGKIVNLMSGDTMSFVGMLQGINMLYAAPFEIAIALVFLYQLLGWAAFAGFVPLLVLWPISSLVMSLAMKIYKGASEARDRRMAVVNELIGAIKFVKFFGWEARWIARVLAAREAEIRWMVKRAVTEVCFSFVWMLAPLAVCIVAFATYVWQGHELTIPVAFTAVALFNMLSMPINVIPGFTIQVIESMVALGRIATFLDEEEVDAQVSTLKKDFTTQVVDPDEGKLAIENGTFEWNSSSNSKDAGKDAKKTKKASWKWTLPLFRKKTATTEDGANTEEDMDHHFELRDIDVEFPHGELTVVAGPTASGKSALLLALMGEMTLKSGKLVMSKNPTKADEHGLTHTIAYAAQSPWLRHQSIKDNILFGYPLDEQRYKDVVEACALKPDFDRLEDGDNTEIGAKGISLSGGQKARVALARAVYARTRIVLLDDPLSAVDSHTARFLVDKLLKGPLLANRTVILVTHHVELVLPCAHYLIRMLDGRIDTQGTIKELRAQGVLEEIAHEEEKEAEKAEAVEEVAKEAKDAVDEPAKDTAPAKKLVEDEHREEGSVKWSVYKTYISASSYTVWAVVLFAIVMTEVSGVGTKFWMNIWGEAYNTPHTMRSASFFETNQVVMAERNLPSLRRAKDDFSTAALPSASEHPFFYVGIYAAISLVSALAGLLSEAVLYTGAIKASRALFKRLLTAVVSATFRWHDVTPQGRMLNRFGNDMKTIDGSLPGSMHMTNASLAAFLVCILTIAFIFPAFLLPAFVISLGYRYIAVGYLNTGRDLRRMESNSKSPIFSGFTELLEGIVTVRAFSAEKRFLEDVHGKIDKTTQMWYTFWMTNRWLMLNFDTLGAASILVTSLFALSGFVPAGIAAICITSAMQFKTNIYWACRFWTILELDLNAVERVVEYLNLPQEPPAIVESNRPPAYWPSSSNEDALITVEGLEIKYAPDLPAVLHDVSFSIKGKERVGLLGRTGSGKSTLAMSLLRFTDPSGGRILIDGIDISKIGLEDLRSRLTFIPQDATLFSGTLRENLDPFGEHEDSECLDVLHRVHLIAQSSDTSRQASRISSRAPSIHGVEREDTETTIVREPSQSSSAAPTIVESDPKTKITLDTQISAGGANMSLGQRQLIAMARALLRRSNIIILDEATSSIDFATDAKIQATIREEFNDALLLTVAHRLSTVIDYDRLIVLDKGRIAEFDTPHNLIQKKDSIFRSMCQQSGMFEELEASAKAKASSEGTKDI